MKELRLPHIIIKTSEQLVCGPCFQRNYRKRKKKTITLGNEELGGVTPGICCQI